MPENSARGLLDLEAVLVGDAAKVRRDAVLERLVSEAKAVKARLDRGLPPKEAEAARRLQQALYAAHQVVRAVWRLHHPR